MAQTIEKSWSKTRESDDMHGKCNSFKNCFLKSGSCLNQNVRKVIKNQNFSMRFFLKFIYTIWRIDWKRFRDVSGNKTSRIRCKRKNRASKTMISHILTRQISEVWSLIRYTTVVPIFFKTPHFFKILLFLSSLPLFS